MEVPLEECGAEDPASADPTSAFGFEGPTEITVTALEPTELLPYSGGADVLISIYNVRDFDPRTAEPRLTEVARGKTGAAGTYFFRGQAPSPGKDYRYRVAVSIPGGQAKKTDVMARDAFALSAGTGQPSRSFPVFVVCPSNVDSLVCAVAEAQVAWKAATAQCEAAWTGGAQGASFCADQAHASIPLNHPRLEANRDTFSWWVGDLEIPPKDWPDLVTRFELTSRIFNEIPFPRYEGIEDLFQRCARGVPIGQGKNAENYPITVPRLYSSTWSGYFPRSEKRIRQDMAAAYLIGLASIYSCMEHRIRQKVKETQRTLRTMSIISFATVALNLPWLIAAGAGGISVIATETYEFILAQKEGRQAISQGVTATFAASLLASGDPNLVVAALEPVINEILKNMDPIEAEAVRAVYPQLVRTATDLVASNAAGAVSGGSNLVSSGASGFPDLSGLALSMSVKAFSMLPKLYAAARMEGLEDALSGAEAAAGDLLKYLSGEEVSPEFKPFLRWVVMALDLSGLADAAIDQFLDQFQQALAAGQSQGGNVAVVPQAGGGGVDVVPTDSAGTPTDAQGVPLPGGVAPSSPPSGGGTIPGAPAPPSVGSDITAIAGVSGAAVGLLILTGAVKFW